MSGMVVTLGALEPPLGEQLEGRASPNKLEALDKHAQAITHLHVYGLITDAESDRARHRLLRLINRAIAP